MRWFFAMALALGVLGASAQERPGNPLYTAPEGLPLQDLRICVDAGHGGQTWGSARGYTGGTRSAVSDQTESDANLRVAMFLWDLLTQAGAEVVMTRTFETRLSADCFASPESDEYSANRREELNIRVRVAEANDCDLLLSIHHNAGGGPETNFSTAFYFEAGGDGSDNAPERTAETVETSRDLANAILTHLHERIGIESRPARHGNYHVIRETSLPAVLVECSFMPNRTQAEWMEDLSYSRLAAIGIFEGILAQFGDEPEAESAPAGEEVSK